VGVMHDGDNDSKHRQDDELLVLESIYGDDVRNVCGQKAWKIWKPLDIIIHLRPIGSASISGDKAFVSVDLHVKCSTSYPANRSPEIFLENAKGVSADDLTLLRAVLTKKAEEMKGTEVIMELCHLVQEFLYERNKPPTGSFHDGMLLQKAAVEHEQKRLRASSEQRERDAVVAFEEMRKERLLWKEAEDEERSPTRDLFGSELVRCVDGVERRICRIDEETSRRDRPHAFCSEWTAMEPGFNREILVSEWSFEYSLRKKAARKSEFTVEPFVSRLEWVQDEMLKLSRLTRVDQSLYPYTLLAIQKKALTSTNVSVRILYGQLIDRNDLAIARCLHSLESQQEVLLPRLAAQLVYAMRWLHESHLYHGALNSSTLWMTNKRFFRFSDYMLRSCVDELCEVFKHCANGDTNFGATLRTEKNQRRKDLSQIGTLFEELRSSTKNSVLRDHFDKFIRDCQSAKSIDQLIDHPFFNQGGGDLMSPSLVSVTSSESADDFERNPHSRLKNEFFYIDFLGRGGFGDVILARNKLDGNEYAVKRIPLDPKDDRLNKKVTREAKLFSRLNHPNVVRYYSAWIEYAPVKSQRVVDRNEEANVPKKAETPDRSEGDDSLMPVPVRNVESRAAKITYDSTAEWSTSFQRIPAATHSESDSEDDDAAPIRTLFSPTLHSTSNNSEFDVLFEGEGEGESGDEGEVSEEPPNQSHAQVAVLPINRMPRILFIQMEYCEKSTLRILIDSGKLLGNQRSIWRIFRETLQGLQYIHQEGMIHRDIKPMNILIDGNDRIKIGDFGLATRDFLVRKSASNGASDGGQSNITKDIGTALYIAPELLSTSADTSDFTTKIDVYSVGIVLFEMFYRPLLPGMERITVITALRNSSIFPNDFASEVPEAHRKAAKELIVMMLKRAPEQRPSVQNLLDSERVPIVEIEESHFQKMFCQAVRKRGGRMHQWMIDRMLAEPLPPAADFLYDQAVCSADRLSLPRLRAIEYICEELSRLCALHAFIPFATHSVAPYSSQSVKRCAKSKLRTCRFIDENGITVALPFDLRRTFVRYCVRNGLNRLKRYAYGKVFSHSDALGGIHPVERNEFAVDSIGACASSSTLTADVLCVVIEAACRLEAISSRKWQLVIGHKSLITAAAMYIGFGDNDAVIKILNVLYSISTANKVLSREQKVERLRVGGEMSFNQANSLLNILEGEDRSLEGLRERTRPLMRARSDAVSELVKTAITDITSTVHILNLLTGEKSERLVFDGSLCYRPQTFASGIIFQLQVLLPHKQSTRPVIVCTGGRYDEMLKEERHVQDPRPPIPLCAVGCGLLVDVIAHLQCSDSPDCKSAWCSALVCSTSNSLLKEKALLVRRLWQRGVSADFLHDPVESVQLNQLIEHCEEKKIDELLIVFDRDEVLVRSRGVDLGKMTFDDALQRFSSHLGPSANVSLESTASHSPIRQISISNTLSATFGNLNVHYALNEKLAFNTKKRIETQVRMSMQKVLSCLAPSTLVDVVVIDIPPEGTRQLTALIDRNGSIDELEEAFTRAAPQLSKYKKELKCIHDVLYDILQSKNSAAIVLFSK
uniref:non-specific serine/threonine protein kinase n=1 Tax=Parascaris univalens TaxID=6257 RepID=A0A915AH84_PARUN